MEARAESVHPAPASAVSAASAFSARSALLLLDLAMTRAPDGARTRRWHLRQGATGCLGSDGL